jgi:hypothetical protein
VAIAPELLPRLKRELDQMQERILDLCDSSTQDRTQVLQVNLNLFPLTAPTPGASE